MSLAFEQDVADVILEPFGNGIDLWAVTHISIGTTAYIERERAVQFALELASRRGVRAFEW